MGRTVSQACRAGLKRSPELNGPPEAFFGMDPHPFGLEGCRANQPDGIPRWSTKLIVFLLLRDFKVEILFLQCQQCQQTKAFQRTYKYKNLFKCQHNSTHINPTEVSL